MILVKDGRPTGTATRRSHLGQRGAGCPAANPLSRGPGVVHSLVARLDASARPRRVPVTSEPNGDALWHPCAGQRAAAFALQSQNNDILS